MCEHLRSLDEMHLYTLLEMLDDDSFRKDFQRLKRGLCLPHFEAAMGLLESSRLRDSAKIAMWVFELEIVHLELIAHYLSEFLRKQRCDVRNEPRGAEGKVNYLSPNLNTQIGYQLSVFNL